MKLELTLKRGDETFTTIADEEEIGIFAPPPEENASLQGAKSETSRKAGSVE